MKLNDSIAHYLHPLDASAEGLTPPTAFTNPFSYTPHPYTLLAANRLQSQLTDHANATKGKMFGVLVVATPNNSIAYLKAYSGVRMPELDKDHFVPPIFDLSEPTGYFKTEEAQLSGFNAAVDALQKDPQLKKAENLVRTLDRLTPDFIAALKDRMKLAKAERDKQRTLANSSLPKEAVEQLNKALIAQSQRQKNLFNQLKKHWESRLDRAQCHYKQLQEPILKLQEERKQRSAQLQKWLFDQYVLLNAQGETIALLSLFIDCEPPAGSGDCAAPKLLHFAYQHQLKPIAMGEFWWGPSPKTEIRHHRQFYPSCNSKCKPILTFMLKGLDVDNATANQGAESELRPSIVYEDDVIIVLDKPAGLLSTPGKTEEASVFTWLKERYPKATGPLLVHRLDMATSGLLLAAKTKNVHEYLQKQFLSKEVKKRYVAVLENLPKNNKGLIDLPLRVDLNDRPRQLFCNTHGKRALTRYEVIHTKSGRTTIYFYPITGRTHQLRVHAAHPLGLNCPIVGDPLYGKGGDRLLLHAERLQFKHPLSNKMLTFTSRPPFLTDELPST